MENRISLLDWKSYPVVVERIKSHTPTGWEPLTVHLFKGKKEYFKWKKEIFIEIVFKVKGESELWRTSFRVRGMSHLLEKGDENVRRKETRGSHLTASDILGEEEIPSTKEIDGRVQL